MNVFCIATVAITLVAQAGERKVSEEDAIAKFADKTFKFTGGEYKDEVFHYRLLSPEKIEPGKKYPAILFLHGAGERGDDNEDQLKYFPEQMAKPEWREKYPCFLIAPQCREGKSWSGFSRPKDPAAVSEQMQVAEGILAEVEKEYPVDLKRVYLTGLSMGGFGSWQLAMRRPEHFAALVPICGGGDETRAAALIKLPIWAFHGAKDNVVKPELSQKMIEAIKQAGGNPKYTEFPDAGHDSWTPAYSDPAGVVPWMFEQVRK
ncbi:MAG TPA: dienelactone hydrolase family protein [Pirellulales bacterium]|jgi:predicted peptidase